jgi:hypothetical protein
MRRQDLWADRLKTREKYPPAIIIIIIAMAAICML